MTTTLITGLRTEADLCRNEAADDIAVLLDAAAAEIERLRGMIKAHVDASNNDGSAGVVDQDRECGDSICHEDDGCPTEGAVLQREWRSMREVLAAIDAALKMGIPAAEVLDENSTIRAAIHEVLTPNAIELTGWPSASPSGTKCSGVE